MAEISLVLEAISTISTLIGFVGQIQDLAGGNASSVITTADVQTVVRGQNAQFFTTVTLADIQTTHDRFYRNWLPSVTSSTRRLRRDVVPDDINQTTGSLYYVFRDLNAARARLADRLNRLREVYRAYAADLHMDELTRGVFAFTHGFALLLHIHITYAELRRIQIGATALDDRRLVTDTRSAIQFVVDGLAALVVIIGNQDPIYLNRRLSLIGSVQPPPQSHPWVVPGNWTCRDNYSPLSTTTSNINLGVAQPPAFMSAPTERQTTALRQQRLQEVRWRTINAVISPGSNVWREWNRLHDQLRRREQTQARVRAVIRPTVIRPLRPIRPRAMMMDAADEVTDDVKGSEARTVGVDVDDEGIDHELLEMSPQDVEDFIALSERLLATDTQDITEGEDGADAALDPFKLAVTTLDEECAVANGGDVGHEPVIDGSGPSREHHSSSTA